MDDSFYDIVLRSLRQITRAIDIYSRELAKKYKLTGPQLVCLRCIAQIKPTTTKELSLRVVLSQATVTRILDRLEDRGLVERQRSPKDKRKVTVRITEAGEELLSVAPIPLQQKLAKRLSSLGEAEQIRISGVLKQVVEMMEAGDLDASPMLAAGPVDASPSEVVDFLESDASD